MAFDFPNAPTEGSLYAPAGAPQYVYTNGAWRMAGSPTPLVATAETRNRIVNGAMQISQENGNTASTVNAYFGADNWVTYFVSTGTFTTQRVQVMTPNGSANRYRVTVTVADAAVAATDRFSIYQQIEGIRIADFQWGAATAKQVILRFGFKGPAGTYCASLRNYAGNRSYPVAFTVTAGQANADTLQTLVIPGDTTGTWPVDTAGAVTLTIELAAGTTFQGTAATWQAGNFTCTSAISNGMATAGNVFELFDVGIYFDLQNTGLAPAWQMPDEAQELQACMRYWEKNISFHTSTRFSGSVTSGLNYYFTLYFKVRKRTVPAIAPSSISSTQNFPATQSLNPNEDGFYENRVANGTGMGLFSCDWVANARM